jgi:hypothetical protein
MSVLSAVLGALSALPDLVNLIQQFMTWIEKISGNDPKGFIKNIGAAMAQLNAAKTDEDRQNAAKAISDIISTLP